MKKDDIVLPPMPEYPDWMPDDLAPRLLAFLKDAQMEAIKTDRQRMHEGANASEAYDTIDSFLRNNLDDDDYALYSKALDDVYSVPQPAEPTIDAPAQVGNVRFGKGAKQSTVIAAAQRHHARMNTPEKEQERIREGAKFLKQLQDCARQPTDPVKVPSRDDLLKAIINYADARATITENRLTEADRYADMNAHDECAQAYADMTALLARYGHTAEPVKKHPDDEAVDALAVAMKTKLAKKRSEGRGGWQAMSASELSALLHEHVAKGDPLDVANIAMMLHQNGQRIDPVKVPSDADLIDLASQHSLVFRDHFGDVLTPWREGVDMGGYLISYSRALLARYVRPAAPEGWQLAPKEPTEEMSKAVRQFFSFDDTSEVVYKNMLKAAPKFGEDS